MRALYLRFCFCWLLVLWVPGAFSETENSDSDTQQFKWFLTLYGGPSIQPDLEHTVYFLWEDVEDTYIVVSALAREVWRYKQWFSFELEGQVGKFFGDEHQWQFNGLLIGRWNKFPWDNYIDTSLAVGDGLSYNTEVSDIEKEDHEDAGNWLNYLLIELTVGLPKYPRWDLVYRIHHRSSIRALIGHGGSNYATLGFKYAF